MFLIAFGATSNGYLNVMNPLRSGVWITLGLWYQQVPKSHPDTSQVAYLAATNNSSVYDGWVLWGRTRNSLAHKPTHSIHSFCERTPARQEHGIMDKGNYKIEPIYGICTSIPSQVRCPRRRVGWFCRVALALYMALVAKVNKLDCGCLGGGNSLH